MTTPVLNRKLVLEGPLRAEDGAGGYTQYWVELGSLWADVKPGTGRERASGGTTLSRVATKITVRGAPEGSDARPKPEQRFREGNRVFTILAVTERDARGHYLTCFTEEEQGA